MYFYDGYSKEKFRYSHFKFSNYVIFSILTDALELTNKYTFLRNFEKIRETEKCNKSENSERNLCFGK